MIGYEPTAAERAARALFGIGMDIDAVREERAEQLGLALDEYEHLRAAAEDFAQSLGLITETGIRAAEEQLLALARALADVGTAAAATAEFDDQLLAGPRRRRMHEAYRAKTRRRNRRRRNHR